MNMCRACRRHGFCRKLACQIVTDDELNDPEFLRDVRAAALAEGVSADAWLEHVNDLYRDFRGWISDARGAEVLLDMEEFERPFIREWFRDFCCTPCAPDIKPRIRDVARERVRVLATILRAAHPAKALLWGVRAANDNRRSAASNS